MKNQRLTNPDGQGMLSGRDVRARLGIGEKALRRLVKCGRLPAYKIGTGRTAPVKFRELDVRLFLESARIDPATVKVPASGYGGSQ